MVSFDMKVNTFGIGYSGIDITQAVHNKLSELETSFNPTDKAIRKGIRGKGFGVGALENEDEDLFVQDSLANYDFSIGNGPDDDEEEVSDEDLGGMISSRSGKTFKISKRKNYDGWTAPSKSIEDKSLNKFEEKCLSGFTEAKNTSRVNPNHPNVYVPNGYCARFNPKCILSPSQAKLYKDEQEITDNLHREEIAFSLQKEGEKRKALTIKDRAKLLDSEDEEEKVKKNLSIATTMLENIRNATSGSSSLNKAFSEFPAKQSRFETYQVLLNRGYNPEDAYETCSHGSNLTIDQSNKELIDFRQTLQKDLDEKKRISEAKRLEKESLEARFITPKSVGLDYTRLDELSKRSQEKPLVEGIISSEKQKLVANMLKNRFRSVGEVDMNKEMSQAELDEHRAKLDQLDITDPRDHAVLTECYGILTRRKLEWHPDANLCKRMNVNNPYPDTTWVGCPEDRRFNLNAKRRYRKSRFSDINNEEKALLAMIKFGEDDENKDDKSSSDSNSDDSGSVKSQTSESKAKFNDIFEAYENRKDAAISKEIKPTSEIGPSLIPDICEDEPKENLKLFKSIFASDESEDDGDDDDDEANADLISVAQPSSEKELNSTENRDSEYKIIEHSSLRDQDDQNQTQDYLCESRLFAHLFAPTNPLQERPKQTTLAERKMDSNHHPLDNLVNQKFHEESKRKWISSSSSSSSDINEVAFSCDLPPVDFVPEDSFSSSSKHKKSKKHKHKIKKKTKKSKKKI